MPFIALLAGTMINCSYKFMGTPIATIQLSLKADGTPVSPALYTPLGATPQKQAVTPAQVTAGQLAHVYLDNIEMIVFEKPQAEGQSALINPEAPFDKTIWGDCTIAAAAR